VEYWLKYKKFNIRKYINEGLIKPKLSRIEELFMENEGKYYNGQFNSDNVQDGIARVEWRSGDIYEGEIYLKMKDGYGRYIWENGISFEG
jgi:hypothetical protein